MHYYYCVCVKEIAEVSCTTRVTLFWSCLCVLALPRNGKGTKNNPAFLDGWTLILPPCPTHARHQDTTFCPQPAICEQSVAAANGKYPFIITPYFVLRLLLSINNNTKKAERVEEGRKRRLAWLSLVHGRAYESRDIIGGKPAVSFCLKVPSCLVLVWIDESYLIRFK